MQELASGGSEEAKLSVGDEEREKTKWPHERERPVEVRNEGKERDTNTDTRGKRAVVEERVERASPFRKR